MSGVLMLNNKNYTATGNLRLGGDVQVTELLSDGVVSTDSDYATASLSRSIADDEIAMIRVKDTVSSVDYEAIIGIQGSQIGTGKDFTVKLHPAGGNVGVRLTKSTVTVNGYSGAWTYMYADVVVISNESDIFKFN